MLGLKVQKNSILQFDQASVPYFLTLLIRLDEHWLLIPENGFSGQLNGVDVQETPGVDHVFAEGTLDAQIVESLVQFLTVAKQHGVDLL